MSDWDYGRPVDERHDTPRPSWPDGTTYSYPLPFPLPQAVDDATGPATGFKAPAGSAPPEDDRGWGGGAAPEPPARERDAFDETSPLPAASQYGSSYPWPP